jgi:hypothetical protein
MRAVLIVGLVVGAGSAVDALLVQRNHLVAPFTLFQVIWFFVVIGVGAGTSPEAGGGPGVAGVLFAVGVVLGALQMWYTARCNKTNTHELCTLLRSLTFALFPAGRGVSLALETYQMIDDPQYASASPAAPTHPSCAQPCVAFVCSTRHLMLVVYFNQPNDALVAMAIEDAIPNHSVTAAASVGQQDAGGGAVHLVGSSGYAPLTTAV